MEKRCESCESCEYYQYALWSIGSERRRVDGLLEELKRARRQREEAMEEVKYLEKEVCMLKARIARLEGGATSDKE